MTEILHLPFDDPEGCGKAYDYSENRKDGILKDTSFTLDAHQGKALSLDGAGECLVPLDIPFSSDFTLTFWVKPKGKNLGWLLNFDGINNYIEQWFTVTSGKWIFLSFVKEGTSFRVYENGSVKYSASIEGTPIGLSLNDSKVDGGSYACLDECRMFNVSKSQNEIIQIFEGSSTQPSEGYSDVRYLVNNENFETFGVYVSASSGIIGGLEKKNTLSVDYSDYHGVVVDKTKPRYKERTISLTCFIHALSKSSFVSQVYSFLEKFDVPGNVQLKIEYDGINKPLIYEVDRSSSMDIDKKWSETDMFGTFTLKLRECEPVKRVLRYIGLGTASITVTTAKMLNIYWGDLVNYDISGEDKTVAHVFTTGGNHDIVITGVIEDIEKFDTNCIVIWDKLQ